MRWAPPARAATQLDAVAVLAPVGHVGHEVDAQRAARTQDARDRLKRRLQVAVAEQRLQDAVRREHGGERARRERQRANVAAHEAQPIGQPRAAAARGGARQHGRGAVDAGEGDAGPRERQGDAAGAAPQLEHAAAGACATRRQNATSRRPSVRAFSQS